MRPKIIGPEKIEYSSQHLVIRAAKLKFPGKKTVKWRYLEHPDVVVVLAVDKYKNVYLVKEWRLAWKREMIQVPGGICNSKSEKGRLVQAHNELREETGMDAKRIRKIGSFYLGTTLKCTMHLYLATKLFPAPKDPDEHEYVKVVKMPFTKAYDLFTKGKKMAPGFTLISFFLAKKFIK